MGEDFLGGQADTALTTDNRKAPALAKAFVRWPTRASLDNLGTGFSPWSNVVLTNEKSPRSREGFLSLADQGSNLDSSGPKPDVLPVTPSASVWQS